LNLIIYLHTKLRGTKTGLICSGSTSELFNEPWLRETKTSKENRFSQLHGPGIIVLQIHNDLKSTPPNFQKGKIEIFVLPLEKLNPPGGIGKSESSWIHPHSHGRTRGHLKKGEGKRFLTRPTLEFSPIKRVAVYLNTKISTMSFEKYLQ
jgi:hypothetical protein